MGTAEGRGAGTTAQAAAELGSHHLASGSELCTTLEIWTSQVKTVLQMCAHISNHLDYSVNPHAQDEKLIAADMQSLTNAPSSDHLPKAPRKAPWPLHRYVLVWLGVLGLIVVAVAGATLLASVWAQSEVDKQEQECCWPEGATPAWMGKELGIRVPEAASDRRAGYKVGQRLDTGLLTFTLPTRDATAYIARLVEGGRKTFPNDQPQKKDYSPADGFAHLGLPEPETLVEGVQTTSECPDGLKTPEGKYLQRCVTIFVHEFTPGSTRLYFKSTMEPTATPPPVPGKTGAK
ncbi:hypothetical protein [Streptomyces sp. NPDC048442]|uniref:hypothetical protein n=1 Tax=Streptomyces sp. NPDC048442 TaxID=3154823 RepID=UPI003434E8AC